MNSPFMHHSPFNLWGKYPIGDTKKVNYYFYYQLLYLKGDCKSTTFFLLNEERTDFLPPETVAQNLGTVANTLPEFYQRVHQSFIINACHLKSFEREGNIYLHHLGEEIIPVGPVYKKPFTAWLLEHGMYPNFPPNKANIPPNTPNITLS